MGIKEKLYAILTEDPGYPTGEDIGTCIDKIEQAFREAGWIESNEVEEIRQRQYRMGWDAAKEPQQPGLLIDLTSTMNVVVGNAILHKDDPKSGVDYGDFTGVAKNLERIFKEHGYVKLPSEELQTIRTALDTAIETVRTWNDMAFKGHAELEMWKLYQKSPEVTQIKAGLQAVLRVLQEQKP